MGGKFFNLAGNHDCTMKKARKDNKPMYIELAIAWA
jgi:hypothetical protein